MTQAVVQVRNIVARSGFANPLTLDVLVTDEDYLKVYADTTLLDNGPDYEITGIGDPNGISIEIIGADDVDNYVGVITFTALYDPPLDQQGSLAAGGVLGRSFESALDQQNRRLQALADPVGRALRLPPNMDVDGELPWPPSDGDVPVWDENLQRIIWGGPAGQAAASAAAAAASAAQAVAAEAAAELAEGSAETAQAAAEAAQAAAEAAAAEAADKLPLAGGTMTGPIGFTYQTTPANPPAGVLKVYSKADGNLYTLLPDGTETEVGSGSGAPSVRDYGAVGDGVTDDSAAIQAAFDAGIGYIPAGTYLLNTGILVDLDDVKSIAVRGDGEEVTKIVYTGTSNAFEFHNDLNPSGDNLGVIVESMSFEFTTSNQATGIYLNLDDVGAGGAQFHRRISNIRFQRAQETGIPQYGLRIRNTTFGTYENITMFSTGLVGCVVRVEGITGVDNVFSNIKGVGVDRVWYSDAKAEGYHLFQVTGVTTRIGIEWAATVNTNAKPLFQAVDCYVDATEYGVKVSDAADVAIIGGCYSNVTAGGYGFHFSQSVALSVGRALVMGVSFISHASSWGVSIGASVSTVIIEGNNFTGGTGVKVDATAAKVILGAGNTFGGMTAEVDNASSTFYRINPSTNFEFNKTLTPETSDGAALGTTAKMWADLFLATGGALDWNNGTNRILQSGGALIVQSAGTNYVVFAGSAMRPNANDGTALGAATISWADLFLASGGVINWANGTYTLTQAAALLTASGGFKSAHATEGLGYATGAGGVIAQATSKTTGVTLNKVTGQITMNGAALAAATIVSFTMTNSAIAAGDVLVLNHVSGGTPGAYTLNARCAAGSATIDVRNNTAGSLSEAIVIGFVLIKGVTA